MGLGPVEDLPTGTRQTVLRESGWCKRTPMHELSLAQGLLDQLVSLAQEHDAETILTVRVEIGDRAGIVIDSFTFGFDAVKTAFQPTRKARLEIKTVPGEDLILAQVEME